MWVLSILMAYRPPIGGDVGMYEPRHTPWYAWSLGRGQSPLMSDINAVPQLLPLASKSLSWGQQPGPSPTFLHVPATTVLMLILAGPL